MPYADQALTRWTGAFIPARLMDGLRSVHATDGTPLLQSETVLSPQRLPSPPARAPDMRWPLLAAGLVLGIELLLVITAGLSLWLGHLKGRPARPRICHP